MKYGYAKKLDLNFDQAIIKTKEALKSEGFGVLTEINVQKTLKEKLNEDYSKYIILGACNPFFAFKSLKAEKQIGLLLPCNVIVYEDEGKVEVSAIMPTVAMGMVDNKDLKDIAELVDSKLKKVIDSIK